jgi:hypothetical protein
MPQYCDSKVLEANWFNWILAAATPALEAFRTAGLLWTKAGISPDTGLQNPSDPRREHCIAFANPVYFSSCDGVIDEIGFTNVDGAVVSVNIAEALEVLSLSSDSWLHEHPHLTVQQEVVVPNLRATGFILEAPVKNSWTAVLLDVGEMCKGIATKFKPQSEEEHQDLTNEALLHVASKMTAKKLVYTPGRAAVFNLLTTTIFRILYSFMNRRTSLRKNQAKLINEAQCGILPQSNRSLRIQHPGTCIRTH